MPEVGSMQRKIQHEKDDVEVSPLKYLNVRCNARAPICVKGMLIGDKINLQLKVREVEVVPAPNAEKKKKGFYPIIQQEGFLKVITKR